MGHGHEAIGVAILLATSALGYYVCAKANTEKKGSYVKGLGLTVGTFIVVVSLLGVLLCAAKTGYFLYKKVSPKICHKYFHMMGKPCGMKGDSGMTGNCGIMGKAPQENPCPSSTK